MTNEDYEQKYTQPELRRKIKDQLMQSDKGGHPGQWSARKSQLLVQEYEKQGGGYKQPEKDEAAKSLEEWTEQDWQTQTGKERARQDGETKRYLPQEVWENLSEEDKKKAEQTKKQASQQGKQHAEWPDAVKQTIHQLDSSTSEAPSQKQNLYEQAKALNISGRSKMSKQQLKQAVEKAKTEAGKPHQRQTPASLDERSADELYERAKALNISGRSKMSKQQLITAIKQVEASNQG